MKKVLRHKALLETLQTASPKLRKAILENCNNDLHCCIVEMSVNLLNGNIKLSPNEIKKLKRNKGILRRIAGLCKKNNRLASRKTVRKTIIQNGKGLPFLIAPLLALIGKAALGGAASAAAGYGVKKAIDKIAN